ncbi:YbjQ family protein [Aestuariivirga sp.]|uniref:YbjQ family protein n=1 Tax=Aestuariivirga sp. TaxID=2650926 RepID=UPI003593341C
MIVTTMDGIAGRITQETMGLVRGTHLWTRRVIKTSFGGIRNFEVTGVQQMDQGLNDAKEQANKAMIDQAKALGGDAVIGVRIDVVEMSNGVFCVNATGTAVKTIPLPITVPVFEATPQQADAMDFDMSFLAARPSFEGSTLRH